MSVTREEIIWGYRLFFGREPENETAIQELMNTASFKELRENFLSCEEFKAGNILLANPKNAKRKITFVHIRKTGGISLITWLSSFYHNSAVVPYTKGLGWLKQSDDELLQYQFFTGHIYYKDYCRFSNDTVKITVLRNPIERIFSLYNFYRYHNIDVHKDPQKEAINLARQLNLLDFCESKNANVRSHIDNAQARSFYRYDNDFLQQIEQYPMEVLETIVDELNTFDIVLTTESINKSVPAIVKILGIEGQYLPMPRLNQSSKKITSHDYMIIYNALKDKLALDFCLYDYACKRAEQFCYN